MRATSACARGVQANNATADYLGDEGRVRADVSLIASRRANIRMSAIAFGMVLGTLTSDGTNFQISNMRSKQFLYGPATPQNVGQFIGGIALPGHVVVNALLGEAPILKHDQPASIDWEGGYYAIKIAGTNDAQEEIHVTPNPADWNLPWAQQRVRVLDVLVTQKGYTLYHVELDDHRPLKTAGPMVDPDHIDPDIPPSGGECNAEIPTRIHIESPDIGKDIRIRYPEGTPCPSTGGSNCASWNPPLQQNIFSQQPVPGLTPVPVGPTPVPVSGP